jgi:hypothetical protein
MQADAMNDALPDFAASSDCGVRGCAPRRQISAIIHDCSVGLARRVPNPRAAPAAGGKPDELSGESAASVYQAATERPSAVYLGVYWMVRDR